MELNKTRCDFSIKLSKCVVRVNGNFRGVFYCLDSNKVKKKIKTVAGAFEKLCTCTHYIKHSLVLMSNTDVEIFNLNIKQMIQTL